MEVAEKRDLGNGRYCRDVTGLWVMKDWLGSELAPIRTLDAEVSLAHHIRSSSHEGCDSSDLAQPCTKGRGRIWEGVCVGECT